MARRLVAAALLALALSTACLADDCSPYRGEPFAASVKQENGQPCCYDDSLESGSTSCLAVPCDADQGCCYEGVYRRADVQTIEVTNPIGRVIVLRNISETGFIGTSRYANDPIAVYAVWNNFRNPYLELVNDPDSDLSNTEYNAMRMKALNFPTSHNLTSIKREGSKVTVSVSYSGEMSAAVMSAPVIKDMIAWADSRVHGVSCRVRSLLNGGGSLFATALALAATCGVVASLASARGRKTELSLTLSALVLAGALLVHSSNADLYCTTADVVVVLRRGICYTTSEAGAKTTISVVPCPAPEVLTCSVAGQAFGCNAREQYATPLTVSIAGEGANIESVELTFTAVGDSSWTKTALVTKDTPGAEANATHFAVEYECSDDVCWSPPHFENLKQYQVTAKAVNADLVSLTADCGIVDNTVTGVPTPTANTVMEEDHCETDRVSVEWLAWVSLSPYPITDYEWELYESCTPECDCTSLILRSDPIPGNVYNHTRILDTGIRLPAHVYSVKVTGTNCAGFSSSTCATYTVTSGGCT